MFKLIPVDPIPSWVSRFTFNELMEIVESYRKDHIIPDDLLECLHSPEDVVGYFNLKFPYFSYPDVMDFPTPLLAVIEYLANIGHGESLYELGQANQIRGEVNNAINYYTLALNAGEKDALYQLGILHEDLATTLCTGPEGPEAARAVDYFKNAFKIDDQICVLSGLWLAKAYSTGFGVEKSEKKAFYYNMELASLLPNDAYHQNDGGSTNVKALYYLGNVYLKGTSFAPKSEETACMYFRRAAGATHLDEHKSLLACYNLGLLAANQCIYAFVPGAMSELVLEFPVHLRSALFWMNKAEDEGEEWIASFQDLV